MSQDFLVILLIPGTVIVVGNIYATFRVWRDELLEPSQRIAQTLLIWLLPLIGATASLWSLREERIERQRFEEPGPDSHMLP